MDKNSKGQKEFTGGGLFGFLKPRHSLKYEILDKRVKDGSAGGLVGKTYEIKFHIPCNDKILYVYSEDAIRGYYLLSDYSLWDEMEAEINGNIDETKEPIEICETYEKAKKSKYYALYKEMEDFIKVKGKNG